MKKIRSPEKIDFSETSKEIEYLYKAIVNITRTGKYRFLIHSPISKKKDTPILNDIFYFVYRFSQLNSHLQTLIYSSENMMFPQELCDLENFKAASIHSNIYGRSFFQGAFPLPSMVKKNEEIEFDLIFFIANEKTSYGIEKDGIFFKTEGFNRFFPFHQFKKTIFIAEKL